MIICFIVMILITGAGPLLHAEMDKAVSVDKDRILFEWYFVSLLCGLDSNSNFKKMYVANITFDPHTDSDKRIGFWSQLKQAELVYPETTERSFL